MAVGTVKAAIHRNQDGTHRIFCQRAKFKHWHELGMHRETDVAFARALQAQTILWKPAIIDRQKFF